MRAPGFWMRGKGGLWSALLSPLGFAYGMGTAARRQFTRSWSCPVPVICVGNLIAGGAGKTPVVLDLAKRLTARGITPHLVSRGYGGIEKGPLRVSRERYDARLVGDEPLLLCATAPTWVSDDRQAACRAALKDGAMCFIFDDGFQDPSVIKNLSLIIVDGGYGFGNGNLIPAGPLRESIAQGLSRADAVIIIGDDTSGSAEQIAGRCTIIRASLKPGPEADELSGRSVLAFAGIGHPEKFFDTLREIGCDVRKSVPFADHHHFSRTEIETLKNTAEHDNLRLVTTEKDLVRIPPEAQEGISVLSVSLEWEDESVIDTLLEPVVTDAQ